MPASLSIGDFSRATQLSIKTLRHYHRLGLLEPAEVDPDTGYRRYTTEQIPAAQVIRRFRDLDMPLEQIRAVLDAPDLRTRNKLIAAHLTRLEQDLARTQQCGRVAAGPARRPGRRRADQPPSGRRDRGRGHHQRRQHRRSAALVPRRARRAVRHPGGARHLRRPGPPGGSYATELFAEEKGEATVFVPTAAEVPLVGRVAPQLIPAAELAVIVHAGPHA